jgi:CubicO group peptidase (beta-lactamase class C family)
LAGAYGVWARRPFGPPVSILAGGALAIYELVEAGAVGNLLTPPYGLQPTGSLALWLQPVYLLIALTMNLLGRRLTRAAPPPPGRRFSNVRLPARGIAAVLLIATLAIAALSGWAAASTGTSIYARLAAWGDGDTYNWARFPSRALPPATSPNLFLRSPGQFDLSKAVGSSNPDQWFTSNETTALLVMQHGKLVLERYYNGADSQTTLTAFSITKSWDSAMLGAAIAAGYIGSLDDAVTGYIPELIHKDPRFASLTLRDLVSMRSGLDWNTSGLLLTDDSVTSNSTALRRAVLDRVRIVSPPGTTFFYNDFNPLLLGIVLERVTGISVTAWLYETLWEPMGAQNPGSFSIDSISGGFEKMESGLNATPVDLTRLGLLYLNGGRWDGRQLIPSQWVAETTASVSSVTMFTAHLSYGMGWWTQVIGGVRVYWAWGNHGEYVMAVPSLDIVVGRFGRQYGLGAPRGNSGGGYAGHVIWPRVLTRIATTVAAAS